MIWVAFIAMVIVCLGMTMVLTAYICSVLYANIRVHAPSTVTIQGSPMNGGEAREREMRKGMSPSDLERLPGVVEEDEEAILIAGTECAVCLDDIEKGQVARVLPQCHHVFHRICADAWLSTNAICPLCRAAPPLSL